MAGRVRVRTAGRAVAHAEARVRRATRLAALPLLVGAVFSCTGCHAIWNGWLDPTVVGNYRQEATLDIRTALTVEDSPWGIPGAIEPTRTDLSLLPQEYTIGPGDQLAIQINELVDQFLPWQAVVIVDETGQINVPRLGRLQATGLTVRQLEQKLAELLSDPRFDLLKEPEVMVNGLLLNEATYSIFGIGVSASSNAPLRAGTFPIRRPDLRLLEAINNVGGLNEFVTEVYVFREEAPHGEATTGPPTGVMESGSESAVSQGGAGEMKEAVPAASAAEPEAPESREIDDGARDAEGDDSADERADILELMQEAPKAVAPPAAAPAAPAAGAPPVPPAPAARAVQESDRLKPEPPPRYIWVDGEFVPNPEARESPVPEDSVPQIPGFEAMQSTVDWSRIAGERDYRILRIPAEALRMGDRDYNIVVRPRDVIRIVSGEIGLYYVMGQVNRPGPYAFNAEQITLKAAVAAAGNLGPLAWPTNCTVYRRTGMREQMIQVDLDAIFAGKTPDFVIRRGDIINVGTSPAAPFLARLRALTLPNPVANVGYSFTYARNFADIDSFSARINPENRPPKFPNLFP